MNAESAEQGPLTVDAIITTYNPDSGLLRCIASLETAPIRKIVMVDDGSTATESVDRLWEELQRPGISLVRHNENRGIAAALNTGLNHLTDAPPDAVLTLDQDSALPPHYIEKLTAAWTHASHSHVKVGMVAPSAIQHSGPTSTVNTTPEGVVLGGEPIQSGLLVPWTTLEDIGWFDESLFIDGVDSDHYLRATNAGYSVVVARDTTIAHSIGHPKRFSFGSVSVSLTVASPFRYYYQVRNLIALARRYRRSQPKWVTRAIAREVRHIIITTIFFKGRVQRLEYILRGFRAGIRKETGKMPVLPQPSAIHD